MHTTHTLTEHITTALLPCGCTLSHGSDSPVLSVWVVSLLVDAHICSATLEAMT
jgi:hypothetical protein